MPAAVQTFTRTTFEMSRAAEYFTVRELQAMTGQERDRFVAVALKELLDNALDACEKADPPIAPTLIITVQWEVPANAVTITVADNGPGLAPDVIRRILNFETRTSDNAAYRSPTRGAQGNALKTVLGIPCALGVQTPIVIEACAVRHTIRAWIDPAGIVHIEHPETHVPFHAGTQVTLTVPALEDCDPVAWARAFALFNPHALVKISVDGTDELPCEVEDNDDDNFYQETSSIGDHEYPPSVTFPVPWKKFLPTDTTSAWWYSVADLKRLIFSHIALARMGGPDLLLRTFVQQFKNLSGTRPAKAVCDSLPTITHLRDFEADEDAVGTLHAAMRLTGKAPSPGILGAVGKEHWLACLQAWYGVKDFSYSTKEGIQEGIPCVVEVAVAQTIEGGQLWTGVNFSPTFDDPCAVTLFSCEGGRGIPTIWGYGVANVLRRLHAYPARGANVAVVVHLVCPALEFLDRGKTRVKKMPDWVKALMLDAIWSAAKAVYRKEEAHIQDAAKENRQAEAQERHAAAVAAAAEPPPAAPPPLNQAVFEVMFQGWEHATGSGSLRVSSRNLYYAVRDLIQLLTPAELTFEYFGKLLAKYRQTVRELPGLYYDPRGVLYEPHTGRVIHLGTCEVEAYTFPAWLYDKILYVEKKTVWPTLQDAQVAERYDMAIIVGEGYATEAIRILFQHASTDRQYQLFVLHDADPYGYNIARTLREETDRMPGYQVEVIDLGLQFETACTLGLRPETFRRKRKCPQSIVLTEAARTAFEGRRTTVDGKTQWICERVELNAFTGPAFVTYLNAQLQAAGVRGKVIPSAAALPSLTQQMVREQLDTQTQRVINAILDLDGIRDRLVHAFQSRVAVDDARQWIQDGLQLTATSSWNSALSNELATRIRPLWDDIYAAAQTEIYAAVAQAQAKKTQVEG